MRCEPDEAPNAHNGTGKPHLVLDRACMQQLRPETSGWIATLRTDDRYRLDIPATGVEPFTLTLAL